jgi:hypothetical protein
MKLARIRCEHGETLGRAKVACFAADNQISVVAASEAGERCFLRLAQGSFLPCLTLSL